MRKNRSISGPCSLATLTSSSPAAGPLLTFDVNDNTAFEIPLSNVSQCATGKNEVTLEFHQADDTEVSLMEVRFYVPPSQSDERQDPVEVRGSTAQPAICNFLRLKRLYFFNLFFFLCPLYYENEEKCKHLYIFNADAVNPFQLGQLLFVPRVIVFLPRWSGWRAAVHF